MKTITAKCPRFDTGCPFSSVQQMDLLNELLGAIPSSHLGNVASAFEKVHQISTKLADEVGQCPVFSTECPFKVKCSNLQPLITELDLRSWGLFIKEMHKQETRSDVHLARELKVGTQDSHREAESVQFVRLFLRGKVPKDVYAKFVGFMYFVYQAIEEEARRNANHEIFKALHFPLELEREKTLEADLQFYFGDAWRETIAPLVNIPCVKDYVSRLHYIGQNEPELLVAHTYTRYLGDLSGGQVLKRVAVKTYDLKEGEGTRFYDFEHLPTKQDHKKFKDKYREMLDSLEGVDKEKATKIVAEANIAFAMNTAMFRFLDSLMGFSTPSTPVISSSAKQGGVAQCPFAKTTTKESATSCPCTPNTDSPKEGCACASPTTSAPLNSSLSNSTTAQCPFASKQATPAPTQPKSGEAQCPFSSKQTPASSLVSPTHGVSGDAAQCPFASNKAPTPALEQSNAQCPFASVAKMFSPQEGEETKGLTRIMNPYYSLAPRILVLLIALFVYSFVFDK
eukprot:TRINITY_DN1772_c0_g1_i1.p1 TRINITY_DN1772_c0_g1~~TRINITY_DN1772_c0_g1_i1.p1  ORF type:complete len:511 (-),score=99.77 TRINITY_DN1772_c0_g1_i1:23-1555(-)